MGNGRDLKGKGKLWLGGHKSEKAIQAGHKETKT